MMLPEDILNDLRTRYSEPHRFYHTLNHIEQGLREIKRLPLTQQEKDLLTFAYWFHDAIYDVKRHDNEKQSALLAMTVAQSLGMNFDQITVIQQLILATKPGRSAQSKLMQFMMDTDLSIFGQSPAVFDEYEQAIRKECEFVPNEIFWSRRAEILKIFLDRPRIYQTASFRDHYEHQARENLKRSIRRATCKSATTAS